MDDTYTPPFTSGDMVGWSHQVSTQHGTKSILRRSAFAAQHRSNSDEPGTGQVGVVLAEAGRNLFDVQFDGAGADDGVRTLTSDELVKLEED